MRQQKRATANAVALFAWDNLRTAGAPVDAVDEDFLNSRIEIRADGFVAGAEVENAARAFALIGAVAATRCEFGVDAFAN